MSELQVGTFCYVKASEAILSTPDLGQLRK
jgi:hypothetical protein